MLSSLIDDLPGNISFPDGIDDDCLIKKQIGCTDPTAKNYDSNATEDDGSCILLGCTDSTACNYDSSADFDNNQCVYPDLSACESCASDGSLLVNDEDNDGVCDDVDTCSGSLDDCGVCNGPGAVYSCGCTNVPAGDCDCNGNTLDALGVCGGSCAADLDDDNICDNVDDCVGSANDCAEDIVCTELPVSDNTFYVDSDGTVYYNATSPFAGFQFTLVGATIGSASGGIVEQLGLSISASNYNALGFSLSNTEIQPGSGILTLSLIHI